MSGVAKRVLGIGELLWDVFPTGKRLGGAPVNFASLCSQLGADSYPVSCVGRDQLGEEIRCELDGLGVNQSLIVEDPGHPTGTVEVTLDAAGKPSYLICRDVAWDFIPWTPRLQALAAEANAVCFGSLAQRNEASRTTIMATLDAVPPDSIRIFDINLRQSFYSKEIISQSLERANVLKLSDEELPVLARLFGLQGTVPGQLEEIRNRFALSLVAYTRGAKGSVLTSREGVFEHDGIPARVIDSVGAGDSFTATLCMGLLNKKSLVAINEQANRVAAFVCSQSGAIPRLPPELVHL